MALGTVVPADPDNSDPKVLLQRAGRPRPFRLLDVYSRAEGFLQLRLYFCIIVWGLFLAGNYALVQFVLLDVEDSDTRDMLADYRLTAPGITTHHQNFVQAAASAASQPAATSFDPYLEAYLPPPQPLSSSLSINGTIVYLQPQTESLGDMTTFAAGSLWLGPSPCTGTTYRRTFLLGSYRTTLPTYSRAVATYGVGPVLEVVVLGQTWTVPIFNVTTDYDMCQVSVCRLVGISATVSFVRLRGKENAWVADSVQGSYSSPWEGSIDTSNECFTRAYVTLTVQLDDVSAPTPAALPAFTGLWHFWAMVGFGGIAGLLIFLLPVPYYLIRVHVLDNNNMPPPFYHHRLKYRGW